MLWNAMPGETRCYRDVAIAHARTSELLTGMSIVVKDGRILGIYPHNELPPLVTNDSSVEIIDASGSTAVPSMVDAHSHLVLPGGAHWLQRAGDPTSTLVLAAEENAARLLVSGVRWIRDVGSPTRGDAGDGRSRALALSVRDMWRHRMYMPHIRAAGTWVTAQGALPAGLAAEARTGKELLDLAVKQLEDGADLVKLYLDGPDPERSPWTPEEVHTIVDSVHKRGAQVAAHATRSAGIRVAAQAGVDTLEHGTEIDNETARLMAKQGVVLVTTLSVYKSFQSFGRTTELPRFADFGAQDTLYANAVESVKNAKRAGVTIVAGTDFGGGSVRAGHIAWEVAALAEAGLEPWEALAAVTWRSGALVGDKRAGRLDQGGPANFFLVHGDPTTDPSALTRVWHVVLSSIAISADPDLARAPQDSSGLS